MASSALVRAEVMNVKQLARYMGVSTAWVYQNKRQIPHRKAGNLIFFSKKAVDEWLATDRDCAGLPPTDPVEHDQAVDPASA